MSIEIGPPLKEWLRPKWRRCFESAGRQDWVAIKTTHSTYDNTLYEALDVCRPEVVYLVAGGWHEIPLAKLDVLVSRLGRDARHLRVRRLLPEGVIP